MKRYKYNYTNYYSPTVWIEDRYKAMTFIAIAVVALLAVLYAVGENMDSEAQSKVIQSVQDYYTYALSHPVSATITGVIEILVLLAILVGAWKFAMFQTSRMGSKEDLAQWQLEERQTDW